ncbi:hypothetical protein PsorP6_007083 [Peronosclerospora sorghi]|uniref:Uncharacterized protein n=1 Tax=Peronosclerospora sorghi TaxID=230839 RepID=A0ACC0W9E2_9STRA|nr:hypothetical protein PsorP6_007083 [Peronosclerospora sorghi]
MPPFPPRTVDDTETRYCFFLPRTFASRDAAEAHCAAFLAFAADATRDFQWHKHAFELHVEETRAAGGRYILSGRTHLGDALQDEWVLAKLVFDLTKHFAPVIGRIADSDGEFLLIQSAHVLPEWVAPETTERRVFVVNGKVHIALPRGNETTGASDPRAFYDPDALDQVLDARCWTEASSSVQHAIQAKLDHVPTYMRENRHGITCVLPEKVAHVLHRHPALVAPAVEAFYDRDPLESTRVCNGMATFLSPGDVLVPQRVIFSRARFAQLKLQAFDPPQAFRAHDARYEWLATRTTRHERQEDVDDDDGRAREAQAMELGMKLACGLELLYAGDDVDQRGVAWHDVVHETVASWPGSTTQSTPISEPDDDGSWLDVHPDTLESELERAASTEAGAHKLHEVATMLNTFVDGVSSVDGVEGTEAVQFDVAAFMDILNGPVPSPPRDDDEDDETLGLHQAMADMDAELARTNVVQTFHRIPDPDATGDGDTGTDEIIGTASLDPLELDFHLVSNLLASMDLQDGHAGPGTTILNELKSLPIP